MTNSAPANKNDDDMLSMHSPNLVDDNVQKISELFPSCITEAKDENGKLKKAVDFDLLRQELSQSLVEGGQERYRLDWPGKRQAILEANSPIAKTLRPARDESVNFDTTENLFIEGDNLDALKLLQESYLGRVKMIYIDPPYNTGSDFIYKDDFSENTADFLERSEQVDEEGNRLIDNPESNGRFHSDWLTMMYSRLKLARGLLSDDGVIFISCDDNEQANLKKICDEVFGPNNFINTLIWEKKKKPSFLNKNMGTKSEYILCFAKNRIFTSAFSVELTEAGKKYPLNNAGNSPGDLVFPANTVSFSIDDQVVPPQDMSLGNIITKLKTELIIENGKNANSFTLYGEWRYSQSKLNEIIKNDESITISNIPFRPNHIKTGGEVKKMHNLLTLQHYDVGTNEDATEECTNLLAGNYFDYTKPTSLLKHLIKSVTYLDKNSIILDFFAGSSSTAHAVMDLNTEDDGNRNFIMVQLDEKTKGNSKANKAGFSSIPEISKERIRRAGRKILADNKDKESIENLDIGFRVLKIDETNMKKVYYTPDEYSQAELDNLESHIKEDRTGEDLLFQVMLDWGLPLSLPIESKQIQGSTVYYVGINSLVACFDTLTTDLVDEVSKDEPLKFVSSELAIAYDQDKTNIKARFAQLSPDTQVKFI